MRTPYVVIAVLVVGLVALSAASGGDRGSSSSVHARTAAPVAVIARRVESVRGLRYRTVPRPVSVTPEQARRDGLADFDRTYPPRRRAADEEVLMLLGLAPPRLSLREVASSLFGQGVAGYYDTRTRRLRTVSGAATSTRVLAETVLAHELTHALEDQRMPLLGRVEQSRGGGEDDATLARTALIEGTATEVMYRYQQRYFSAEEALVGSLAAASADTGSMPPFLQSQTVFPYVGGQAFVRDLLRRAGGRWDLVDTAERLRPPGSTEQVMHPERYLRADAPRPVRLTVRRVLGAGWTRAGSGTWGEFQTREMLADSGGGGASMAAAGWGGDRWELWRAQPVADGCASPCRAADVLAMRWVWDTARDEGEFAARLRAWVRDGVEGAPAGPDVWRLHDGGAAAVGVANGVVTLVLAPDVATAQRVAATG
jgi:hypothetical protein